MIEPFPMKLYEFLRHPPPGQPDDTSRAAVGGRRLTTAALDECIGVLLHKCRIECDRCWFASGKGGPTLVKIAVFNEIKTRPS